MKKNVVQRPSWQPATAPSKPYTIKTILVSNSVTFLLGVVCSILTGVIFAQSSEMNMQGGELLLLTCNGRRFNTNRLSRTEFEMECVPSPGEPVPAEPTDVPVEPTAVPSEPTAVPTQPVMPTPAPPVDPTTEAPSSPPIGDNNTYYVSKYGSNGDGLSWATAWNELDQINWSVVQPGDIVYLDGGSSEMVYSSTLQPTTSGTSDDPIRIQLSSEPGRNGQAIISGGRSTPLPFCGQTDYDYNEAGLNSYGAKFENAAHLIVDGTKWRGIVIHGMKNDGIRFYPTSDHVTLRYLELYDNGSVYQNEGAWYSDGKGVRLEGSNHTIERTLIHDNGQDAIQSNGAGVHNFIIRESWFYNSRIHPTVTEQSYNYCTHTDGLQIYDGGVVSGITIEDSILGPGFTNTLLLGDKNVDVNDVTIRNVLMLKGAENNISAHSSATTAVNNWTIENVTIYAPDTAYNAIYYKGRDLTIQNSIVVGSHINIPNTTPVTSNNCQWNTTGVDIGVDVNPLFQLAVPDAFSDGMYAPQDSTCGNSGASIASVEQLMNMP